MTAFQNIEKIFTYSPLIIIMASMIAAAVLSAAGKNDKKYAPAIFSVTGAGIILTAGWILLYSVNPVEFSGGIFLNRDYIPAYLISVMLISLPSGAGGTCGNVNKYLVNAGALSASVLSGHPAVLLTSFYAAGLFSGKRSYFFFTGGLVFAVMASVNGDFVGIKAEKLAVTGLLFIMMMDSVAARVSLAEEGPEQAGSILPVTVVQLFIILRLICDNTEFIYINAAGVAAAGLIGYSFFRAVTEENARSFLVQSSASLFMFICMVLIFTVSGPGSAAFAVSVYSIGALGVIIFSSDGENLKRTVADLKYKEGKTRNMHAVLVYFLSAAVLEAAAFLWLYEKARPAQLSRLIMLFGALIYITGMLNKFFIFTSAALRFRPGQPGTAEIKETVRMSVFVVFSVIILVI